MNTLLYEWAQSIGGENISIDDAEELIKDYNDYVELTTIDTSYDY